MGGYQAALLYVTISVLAVATALSVGVCFYLYRWRSIIIRDKHLMVPEELIKWLRLLRSELQQGNAVLTKGLSGTTLELRTVRQGLSSGLQAVDQLSSATTTLHRALDERDAEIKRLRMGYDTELFRRFLIRFLKVKQVVADAAVEPISHGNFTQIDRLLDDAFDECGVETFAPSLGSDYRTSVGVADNPHILETQDSA